MNEHETNEREALESKFATLSRVAFGILLLGTIPTSFFNYLIDRPYVLIVVTALFFVFALIYPLMPKPKTGRAFDHFLQYAMLAGVTSAVVLFFLAVVDMFSSYSLWYPER